jgi:dihydrofolate reductase
LLPEAAKLPILEREARYLLPIFHISYFIFLVKISAIVAYSRNFAIGRKGELPWSLPADLRRFRQLTTGHCVLMGRKTQESIGRVLPNRINIVLTRRASEFKSEGQLFYVDTLEKAFDYAQELRGETELFVIGGGEIYAQALPFCQCVYATEVDTIITEADAFFPDLSSQKEWTRAEEIQGLVDEKNILPHSFVRWQREG